MSIPPEASAPDLDSGPRRGDRLLAALGWMVTVVLVALLMLAHTFVDESDAGAEGGRAVADVMAAVQGKYMVGAAQVQPQSADLMLEQARTLLAQPGRTGVGQRLRFIALAGHVGGPEAGREAFRELEVDLQRAADAGESVSMSETDQAALDALRAATGERPVRLADDQRTALSDGLGWFGRLAAADATEDPVALDAVAGQATQTFAIVFGAALVGGTALFVGFIGLVVVAVFGALRRLRGGVVGRPRRAGVLAETFAVWLLMFLGLQQLAGLLSMMLPGLGLLPVAVAFFGSLAALAWPVLRGWTWSDLRTAIGWVRPRAGLAEVFVGVGCYAMALPILGLGIIGTLVLMLISGGFEAAEGGRIFQEDVGPAHPIIGLFASGDLGVYLQVLLLGAVAAPIVEETMFRGVLHRALREAFGGLGTGIAAVVAVLGSALVFAAIHPQGWVAIPALGSLGAAFALAREWRGSLVAPMIMHALNNASVLTLVALVAAG